MQNSARIKPLIFLATAALLLQGCTIYPSHSSTRVSAQYQTSGAHLHFSDYDRRYIQQYYGHRQPSSHKVPPSYYQRYNRYQKLPPKYRPKPLNRELNRKLSRLPTGYTRVRIGNDIAIMNTRTRVLSDIMWRIR